MIDYTLSDQAIVNIVLPILIIFITIPSLYLIFFKQVEKQNSENKSKNGVDKEESKIESAGKNIFNGRIENINKRREQNRILEEEKELNRLIELEEKEKLLNSTKKSNTKKTKIKKASPKTAITKKAKDVKEVDLSSTNTKTKTPILKEKIVVPSKIVEQKRGGIISADKQKRVNYPTVNINTSNTQYPIIRKPNFNSIIRSFRLGKNNRKGFKEEELYKFIKMYFRNNFEVIDNAMLAIRDGVNPFEPDIVMVSKGLKNIYIDIEIDEPYSGISRKLTHCYPEDVTRDNFFVDRGWLVIRFSEYQVHNQIMECLFQINKVISACDANLSEKNLLSYSKINTENCWDKNKSRFWEKTNYRENYLNHNFNPIIESKKIINEALTLSELLEEKLVTPQLPIQKKEISNDYVNSDEKKVIKPTLSYEKKELNSNNINIKYLIEKAINEHLAVKIEYTNWNGESSSRKITNLEYTKEFIKDGYAHKEHFIGYCHKRSEERSFKISRIKYMEILS